MPGAIVYEGTSFIDGAPIVVIAVWDSSNRKTGGMLQTYILRSDIDPREASKTGADRSICGDCRHRGTATDDPKAKQAKGRSCYVVLGQGPTVVYKTYKRGGYPYADSTTQRRALGRGRTVRIGTYGDGAAAPQYVFDELCAEADGHTAYSHNGGDPKRYMISADTLREAQQAWASKYRTFRVVRAVSEIQPNEVLCPASEEAGMKTTCERCLLCGGTSVKAKSVAIVVHGAGATHF